MVPSRLAIIASWSGQRELVPALAALTNLNLASMLEAIQTGKPLPLLYESGLRYRREPLAAARCVPCWNPNKGPGQPQITEQWLTAPVLLQEIAAGAPSGSDCEELASYRAAELQLVGERALALPVPNGAGGFHIVVRRANGRIEDPSRLLGM